MYCFLRLKPLANPLTVGSIGSLEAIVCRRPPVTMPSISWIHGRGDTSTEDPGVIIQNSSKVIWIHSNLFHGLSSFSPSKRRCSEIWTVPPIFIHFQAHPIYPPYPEPGSSRSLAYLGPRNRSRVETLRLTFSSTQSQIGVKCNTHTHKHMRNM